MTLSVVVTHYKTPELLKLCLHYAKKSLDGIAHEIIVADSETNETMAELAREDFPEVKFLGFTKNVGYSKLANAGINEARGNYVFLINADIVLNREAVHALLAYIREHPDVGMVGPELLNFSGSHQDSCFRFYTPLTIMCRRTFLAKTRFCKEEVTRFLMVKERKQDTKTQEHGIDVDWLMGSALMIRKNAIQRVGLLDERFFMYFEDVDWCRRFWQNGYRVVYLASATITHYHQQASKKWGGMWEPLLNKQTRIHLSSAMKYFLKHGFF